MRLSARLVILAGILLAAPVGAQSPSQIREFEHAPSPALAGDLLYSLYLPPGYDEGNRRYPVLYLLHGKDGNHLEWLHDGHVRETLDGLIAAGRVAPMIVVMPDGGGSSWYVDSKDVGGVGDYASAIGRDLVAAIDGSLRSRAEPQSRAIGGLSMGGFGALRLALAQPFRYAAAASFSGALWSQITADSTPPPWINRVFSGSFGDPFQAARFAAQSPMGMIDGAAAAKGAPVIFLSVGDDDRYKLYDDTYAAFTKMRAAGLSVEMRMTGGDHEWTTWAEELPDALLFFDQAFKRSE
jgi:S-formylglutathione hydrolase FrmB